NYADLPEVEQCLRDWYALLDAEPFIRFTAGGKGGGESVSLPARGRSPPRATRRPGATAIPSSSPRAPRSWARGIPPSKPGGQHRFEARIRKKLASGDWIVALARGTRPMGYLHRPGVPPFAFTNPIWVE